MKLLKNLYLKGHNYFKYLVSFDLPASKISFSLAIGIFIGITIPMGLQTILVIPAALLFRCNLPIALSATLISNPFTIIPIYATAAFIGEQFTGIKISMSKISKVIHNPSVHNLWNLGYNTLGILLLGTLVMGVVLSLAIYYASLSLILKHRAKLNE